MPPERYVCIHGHFYQPPRDDPWTGEIERQPSAAPFHDWNERITRECYSPNAVLGNYPRISFNFGPTLLSWMERKEPSTYAAVLAADRESIRRFSGHGSAMAQAYNHMILPLANRRDRVTQVVWGVRDFEHRFGRKPAGMWLPETAVDRETLEVLAEQGIRFTVLAPHQARNPTPVDPTRAYRMSLSGGRSIALFFYHEGVSKAVAFDALLKDGGLFALRLLSVFAQDPHQEGPQIVHIAADGETYGHHHRHGEVALRGCLDRVESEPAVRLTNYAEFLEKHPPRDAIGIVEKSSWSCVHGIDRWWSDCGCSAGGNPSWKQGWRTPLRDALDWLRDWAALRYETLAGRWLRDPWRGRDRLIDLLLDPSEQARDRFFREEGIGPLGPADQETVLKLLELQRNTLLMYTSCGWFFDDLTRIETVQILRYAAKAIRLGRELFGESAEELFLKILEKAHSNIPEAGNGRQVYERLVVR